MLNSLALEFILHIDEDLKSFLFEIWAEEDEQEDFCLVSCESTALTCGMHAQMRVWNTSQARAYMQMRARALALKQTIMRV